ncbi:MAG: site-2 protease family protein [Legionellaceae bacterium]|nr:site-2 protease family protein [Legionellaceae bacterium]
MQTLSLIQTIAIWIVPVLLSITLHEAAHAWVASRCGDTTAKALGRLSMNPLRHVDLIGTVLVPIVIAVLSDFRFVFGWAKPVPINWYQLRHPRRDMALVALAGPMANLLMALMWASLVKIGFMGGPQQSMMALFLVLTGEAGILINLVLAILNLIPIPPLDGSRVVASLLPPKFAIHYLKIEPFGFFILVLLLFTGVLGGLIRIPMVWAIHFIHTLFNIMPGIPAL